MACEYTRIEMPAPFPDSLCHRCRWMRLVEAKRSSFLQCTEPTMPKYLPQPVRDCPRHDPKS